jgi:hypothetical protein
MQRHSQPQLEQKGDIRQGGNDEYTDYRRNLITKEINLNLKIRNKEHVAALSGINKEV